jgi:hypothetical protein
MSDSSRWLLAIFLAIFFGVLGRLALRNSTLGRRLRSAQYPTGVLLRHYERALKEVMRICTPVFLGFAVARAFQQAAPSEVFWTTFLVGYILIWLFLQRVFFSMIRLQITSFDLSKLLLVDLWNFLGLAFMYLVWAFLTVSTPRPALVLAIFLFDLFAQIVLCLLWWWRGAKGGSRPSVMHGKGAPPAPTASPTGS